MKRIDRYIVKGLLLRLLLTHAVIFGLYFIFDIMKRMDQLQAGELSDTLPRIFIFYAYQIPAQVLDIVPVLLLLSAGLLFVQLSRNQELLTLMASGISLRRVSLPVFAVTLPVMVLIIAGRESIVPHAYRQRELMDRKLEQKVRGPFLIPDHKQGYKLYVGHYDFAEQRMTNVAVFWLHDNGVPRQILEADYGRWGEGGTILLENVSSHEYDAEGKLTVEPEVFADQTLQTSLTPYNLVMAEKESLATRMPALTLKELTDRIRAQPDNPHFRALYHSRLAEFVAPFVLLLVGLPILLGFEHNQQSRLVGGFICIIVAVAYHVCNFIAMSMGNTGIIPPFVAGWAMPAIASVAGGWLLATIRT
jgi:LPS export ABC transporter permease LptG